ncbi:MAG: response regulator [Planctomycetes bacterium]|nr:response regulator [Planctomycetota bacterium]
MRVMIIEDEQDIRGFINKAFTLHDGSLEVIETSNGMEAVRQIATDPPDGVILDMLMPDMDGWEFLQIMDALDTKLPIVILTAVHRDNAALCGIMTTYSNVISIENKPLSMEDAGRVLESLKNASK